MKKRIIASVIIATFTISSSMVAFANPWKSNHGQEMKKVRQNIKQTLKGEKREKDEKNEKDENVTTPEAIFWTTPGAIGITTPSAIYFKNHGQEMKKIRQNIKQTLKDEKDEKDENVTTPGAIFWTTPGAVGITTPSAISFKNHGQEVKHAVQIIKKTLKEKMVTTSGAVYVTTPSAIYVKSYNVKMLSRKKHEDKNKKKKINHNKNNNRR